MTGPTRRRVELPVDGLMPRIGKIRLGTTSAYERNGETRYRPVKADHFVVVEDESGITSKAAVEAFTERYGPEPRVIHAALPGETPDDVMEGAWRLYGTGGKLKLKCDGERCDMRNASGGWTEGACECKRRGLQPDDREHCTLTYTVQLLLPDVAGVGVWQLDSGSEISARRMATWLSMMHHLRGSLLMVEFDLYLVPVSVSPEGKATTVYVLDPRAHDATPRQILERGAETRTAPELPPPAADESSEPTLDRGGFDDAGAGLPAGADPPGDDPPPAPASPPTTSILQDNVGLAIRWISPPTKKRLHALCDHYGVTPSRDGIIAAWGDRAVDEHLDLDQLCDKLEAELNAAEQTSLIPDEPLASEAVD